MSYEFRYKRFKDPPDKWNIVTSGSLDDCLTDFFHYKDKGIGDTSSQDVEKGWAEICIWFGGYDYEPD